MPGDQDAAAVAACLRRGAGAPDVAWAVSRLIGALADDADRGRRARGRALGERPPPRRRRAAAGGQPPPGAPGRLHREAGAFATGGPAWGRGANTISMALERLDDTDTRRLLSYASPGLERRAGRADHRRGRGQPAVRRASGGAGRRRGDGGGPAAVAPGAARGPARGAARAGAGGRRRRGRGRQGLPGGRRRGSGRPAGRRRARPARPARARRAHAPSAGTGSAMRSFRTPHTASCRRRGGAELHVGLAQAGSTPTGRATRWSATTSSGPFRLQTELGMAGDATARLGEEAGTRLAAAGRRADTMGDPRRARFLLERALDLLPERSPERAAAMVELAAAGWNLLPSGGAEHAAGRRRGSRRRSSARAPSSCGRGCCASAPCRRRPPRPWTSAR